MKRQWKVWAMMVLAIVMVTAACSKDDDPANNDLFVGTYNGTISYSDGEETINDEDGRVTVVKVGATYTFDFGSGIPNLTGVKFQEKDDGTYISIGEGLTGITISADKLDILVINDEGTWRADCTR